MSLRSMRDLESKSNSIVPQMMCADQENRVGQEQVYREGDIRTAPPPQGNQSRKVFVNPLFDPDPGIDRSLPRNRAMSFAGDGGVLGGTGVVPTHPKLLGSGALVNTRRREIRGDGWAHREASSTWQGIAEHDSAGPKVDLKGEVDMDDDAFLELDPEEEEVFARPAAAPSPWRLLARYVNQRMPNTEDLTDHFHAVWQIRSGVNFAPIRKNWYVITLGSQGDFDFVSRGGPWIHRGNALLVAPFKGNSRPSESVLEAVPVWVRFYNVPWDKQTSAYGWRIGKLLGKVLAVDVDDSGMSVREFLRIRIELPLNRRLQMQVSIGIKGGEEEPKKYELRYERVPHYCFWCGFIGHDDTECEKKRLGVPKKEYDDRLRCSPLRKFTYRSASIPAGAKPKSATGPDFSTSNMGASNLGSAPPGRSIRRQYNTETIVPESVDARDGFEERKSSGDPEIDADLAMRVRTMQMQLANEVPEQTAGRGRGIGRRQPKTAGRGKGGIPMPIPLAVRPPIRSLMSSPRSMHLPDMGPPIRGIDSLVVSFRPSDVVMSDADSVLGKRAAEQEGQRNEVMGEDNNAMDKCMAGDGGKSKKGRVKCSQVDHDGKQEVVVNEDGMEKEATSPGAAGKLTGPNVVPRQEQ